MTELCLRDEKVTNTFGIIQIKYSNNCVTTGNSKEINKNNRVKKKNWVQIYYKNQ